jgi:hypothetical protein
MTEVFDAGPPIVAADLNPIRAKDEGDIVAADLNPVRATDATMIVAADLNPIRGQPR